MNRFKLPPYKKHVMDNGLTVLLLPQHRGVPLVSFRLMLRAGALSDPAGREGLSSLTVELLRKGTQKLSAREFSNRLDSVGGVFAADADYESSGFTAEFMRKDLDTGFFLLSEALLNPTFPAEEVCKLARRRSDSLRQAKDSPSAVIQTYHEAFLFGEHPYGRSIWGDEESNLLINREEIVDFWKSNYVPNQVILTAVGDFNEGEMRNRLEHLLGGWRRREIPTVGTDGFHPPPGPRILLIDKPDTNQTFFRIGSLGIERRNPDYVKIQTLNTILGGCFTSWLNTALRIKSGLTYGAKSFFVALEQPGSFTIASYTPTEATEKAIDLVLEQYRRWHRQGVDEEELSSVKKYIRGQFPPSLETNDQLADVLTDLEFYGLDRSFVDGYLDQVDALNPRESRRLIRENFPSPESLTFTLIGESEKIRSRVERFGTITERSINEPGF